MKKSLLLGAAMSICLIAGAQQRDLSKVTKAEVRPVTYGQQNAESGITTPQGGDYLGGLYNRSGDILKTPISSSSNAYGIISIDQTVLTALPDLNMVAFGNRAGGPMGATGNDIKMVYSTDLGSTWNNFIISPVSGSMFRYPSATVYNPAGNTDPANMYAIISGPYTGASGWVGQYFGSTKFGGTEDVHITYEPNQSNIYINHMNNGLTVTPNGNIHVASDRLNGTETSYTHNGWEILNGVFNETTHMVDWVLPRTTIDPMLAEENRVDGTNLAFSPDGTVGYIVGTGVDPDLSYNPYGMEWPVVYKTVDNGATFEKIEPFDFSTIAIFNELLFPTRVNLDLVVPRWTNKWQGGNQNGTTVDKNGNLHIAGVVRGTISLDYVDSAGYFYTYEPAYIFDVFMNGDGTWNAQLIDSIRSEPVETANPFTVGWDQHIQMSRTDDGSKVFVTWADTDPALWSGSVTTNLQPDIFTWAYNMDDHKYTLAVNNTQLGDYWGDNLWMRTSQVVLKSGSDYFVPISTSAPTVANGTADGPMIHNYVSGIGFNEADFVIQKVQNVTPENNASVSQNYPNPCNATTQINLTLNKAASVSVEVYNLVGQKVIELPARALSAGNHVLDINAANLNAGIYTYSVIANGERVSRKMSVK